MKRIQRTRRKMSRVMDELYTALFLSGAKEVQMTVNREEEGYRLRLTADYDRQYRDRLEKLCQLLQPEERNPALVETYWELTGGDPYSDESELSLVGHMLDVASVTVSEERVAMALFMRYR